MNQEIITNCLVGLFMACAVILIICFVIWPFFLKKEKKEEESIFDLKIIQNAIGQYEVTCRKRGAGLYGQYLKAEFSDFEKASNLVEEIKLGKRNYSGQRVKVHHVIKEEEV